ncbi:MAG: TrmH family RNA methyltransferase [Treponema sp.]|jgi:TrmH family RNA methyltransferase|nr:TrmH family RNA methyltransferase [Treponema sp.]
MIRKLARLPRHQRLRKLYALFTRAESELLSARRGGDPFPGAARGPSPRELAELLVADEDFSPAARDALRSAAAAFGAPAFPGNGAPSGGGAGFPELLRGINAVRHILLSETGRSPADWDFTDFSDVLSDQTGSAGTLDPCRRRVFAGMTVYLEDIRSPYNVGSMFRTAEFFGAAGLYLSPLCADPLHPRSLRTAMGSAAVLPWERKTLDTLAGPCFALETGGAPLGDFPFPPAGTMLVGNEELGLSPGALAKADRSAGRVSIPGYGAKGSLNAAAAFGIAVHAWAESLRAQTAAPPRRE